MAKIRSVDFLPEIFQTDVNKQFLAATLDQLIQFTGCSNIYLPLYQALCFIIKTTQKNDIYFSP